MKQINFVLALMICASMLLTACGGTVPVEPAPIIQVDEVGIQIATVLPNVDAGGVFSPFDIGAGLTFQSEILKTQFNNCINKATSVNPAYLVTEFTGNDETVDFQKIWWCGGPEISEGDLVFMSALTMSQAFPGRYDDAIVVGVGTIWKAGEIIKVVILTATATLVGELTGELYYQHHSNRNHNPNLSWAQARVWITAFLAGEMTLFYSDPNKQCGFLRDDSGVVVKISAWVIDKAGQAYIMFFWEKTPGKPWGGAYPMDEQERFENGPELKDGWSYTLSSCPKNFPGLQQAAP